MADMESWLPVDPKSPFSIYNIPFGVISPHQFSPPLPRLGVAIGDFVLDLHEFANCGGFPVFKGNAPPPRHIWRESTLNAFASLGSAFTREIRRYIQLVLKRDSPFPYALEENLDAQSKCIRWRAECDMRVPMKIGDYTDFYAGLHHAYNVGVMFRGKENALQPNYMHLPVGYHGRASSVVVSGTPIRRPHGQILLNPKAEKKEPVLQPSKKLDLELELGCFVCNANMRHLPDQGSPIRVGEAGEFLFGLVLMNDWSARDIQAWEYVPLGPFNSKNFATTISPWVVLTSALEPFAAQGIPHPNPQDILPYLNERDKPTHYDIDLTVAITTASGTKTTISRTNATNLLWSFPQMLAHHTIGGCNFNTGDLLGSGTISGEKREEKGCLLEQTENGKAGVMLQGGVIRLFLEDGDTVTITGVCGKEGAYVGFGECTGRIEPALTLAFD